MNRKVLITGSYKAREALDLLKANSIDTIMGPPHTTARDLREIVAAEQPEAFIIRMGDINADVIAASRRLRVISKHGVGVDNIDVDAATASGIAVTITKGANSRSVAEHALTLILALTRDLHVLDASVRRGDWKKANYRSRELTGKNLGLVGIGSIGCELVKLVQPFGMRICAFDPHVADSALAEGVARAASLDELLEAADIVSIHCPLIKQTRGLMGTEQFKRMKNTGLLVNTARGAIIDEAALGQALRRGLIAGAGLDGFDPEPPTTDNPLLQFPNVLLTPHIAGSTEESLTRMGVQAARNVLDILDDGPIDSACLVNAVSP